MIQEQYISFETAKLLKEKGFNEPAVTVYNEYGDLHSIKCYDNICNSNYNDITRYKANFYCTAPTQQVAMRWLREVHNLFIQICIIPHTTITIEQKYYFFIIHKDRRTLAFKKDFPSEYYFTYEEACEEAVRYCLENLI